MTLTPMVAVVGDGCDRIVGERAGEEWCCRRDSEASLYRPRLHDRVNLSNALHVTVLTNNLGASKGLGQSTVEDYLLLTCGSGENNESEPWGCPTVPICMASARAFWTLHWSAEKTRRHSIDKCGLMIVGFNHLWFSWGRCWRRKVSDGLALTWRGLERGGTGLEQLYGRISTAKNTRQFREACAIGINAKISIFQVLPADHAP